MTPSARDANLNEGALSRLCKAIQDDIDNGRMFGTSIIVARGGKIGLQKVFGTVTLMAELLATMTSTSQCRFQSLLLPRSFSEPLTKAASPWTQKSPKFFPSLALVAIVANFSTIRLAHSVVFYPQESLWKT